MNRWWASLEKPPVPDRGGITRASFYDAGHCSEPRSGADAPGQSGAANYAVGRLRIDNPVTTLLASSPLSQSGGGAEGCHRCTMQAPQDGGNWTPP